MFSIIAITHVPTTVIDAAADNALGSLATFIDSRRLRPRIRFALWMF